MTVTHTLIIALDVAIGLAAGAGMALHLWRSVRRLTDAERPRRSLLAGYAIRAGAMLAMAALLFRLHGVMAVALVPGWWIGRMVTVHRMANSR